MTGTTAAIWTYVKTVAALGAVSILGSWLASGKTDVFATTWSEWQSYLAVAVAAIIPVIITALNPADTRYGISKSA
jgi:hypothetical protein